jgi:methylated-DNA-[protein]-cysteine S-methyltransferase
MSRTTSTRSREVPGTEQERWYLDVDSPVGILRVVVAGEAVVGLYHGEHSPSPAPDVLGRSSLSVPAASPARSQTPSMAAPPGPGTAGPAPSEPRTENADAHRDAEQELDHEACPVASDRVLRRAAVELHEYFAGTRRTFDVPVVLHGTAFQRAVWTVVADIPYGERRSYRDIAEQVGNAAMGRAIGAAVRANPVSIIVPGHRVVASTGAVVGYAAGVAVKTALLDHEAGRGRHIPPTSAAPADHGHTEPTYDARVM